MFECSFKQITDTEKKIVTKRTQWKENKYKYSFFVLDTNNIFISPLFDGQ